jgi:uncharacterized protein
MHKSVTIPIDKTDSVSGVISSSDTKTKGKRHGIIFAHGAANDMHNDLLVALAERFAQAGHVCLRFNFPYKEKGRKSPDSQNKLVQTWKTVLEFFQDAAKGRYDELVAAGKSMGGRVASQMAAQGNLPVDRLIFLGYPLHAPGKKDHLRDAHLYDIRVPMLFFSGTRDPFCDLSLLRPVLDRLQSPWDLEIIDGGDHSLNLPKSRSHEQQNIYDQVFTRGRDWLSGP